MNLESSTRFQFPSSLGSWAPLKGSIYLYTMGRLGTGFRAGFYTRVLGAGGGLRKGLGVLWSVLRVLYTLRTT